MTDDGHLSLNTGFDTYAALFSEPDVRVLRPHWVVAADAYLDALARTRRQLLPTAAAFLVTLGLGITVAFTSAPLIIAVMSFGPMVQAVTLLPYVHAQGRRSQALVYLLRVWRDMPPRADRPGLSPERWARAIVEQHDTVSEQPQP